MAYKLQANFAGGELDPVLRKRISLNKYHNGLATARNVVIGRTGRIITRPGRKYIKDGGNLSGGSITIGADKKVIVHAMPWKGRYLEFGEGYVQVYEADGTVVGQSTHNVWQEEDFEYLQFVNVKMENTYNVSINGAVPAYSSGYATMVFYGKDTGSSPQTNIIFDDGTILTTQLSNYFFMPIGVASVTTGTYNGTSYDVDYVIAAVINGHPSTNVLTLTHSSTSAQLPAAATVNSFAGIKVTDSAAPTGKTLSGDDVDIEVRIYRRPTNGGAYGFIGSSKAYTSGTGFILFDFIDRGQDADYTNQPPDYASGIKEVVSNPISFFSNEIIRSGSMYQGRLVASHGDDLVFSRPGKPGNFLRDYPLNGSSALSTNIQGNGSNEILAIIEDNGLLVFTNDGVFLHTGTLSPSNLAFDKKSPVVIDYRVPPLNISGGTIFVDVQSNSVRQLRYFDEKRSYVADELSIFSDHLFRENRITSWAFSEGSLPLLWVVFADGTYATFTYDESQEMRAWTRHDSGTGIERVCQIPAGFDSSGDRVSPRLVFVCKKTNGTQRWIEHGVDRFVTGEDLETNPEADKGEKAAAMDSMVSWSALLNDDLTNDDITITPVVAGTWDGDLTLADVNDAIFPDPGAGTVGEVFRWFHPVDRTSIDLTITARASDDSVTVSPSAEFPLAYATNPRLYKTKNSFTGLDHMDGETVAIMMDGYVKASPNNDFENYTTVTVSSGTIALPNSELGAIVHIGRPYTKDIETLNINTVEQRPTHNESVTCNKVKIETYQSRGMYVGSKFPLNDKITGDANDLATGRTLKPFDSYAVNYEDPNPITGNRYDQPVDKSIQMTVPGNWESNGRICLREVDPVHFELLAITPDIDDQRR